MLCHIAGVEPNARTSAKFAIIPLVNEARRFGIGITFRGVPTETEASRPNTETVYTNLPSPDPDVAYPAREPGKALFGDPLENPVPRRQYEDEPPPQRRRD